MKTVRHTGLVLKLIGLTAGMFLFGFALVPLYDVFCDITGLGGRTDGGAAAVTEQVDESRSVRVEFVAAVPSAAPWEFAPIVASMQAHPGKLYRTAFRARNPTGRPMTGQAVPSVAPGIAAEHFKKVECFCFTQQSFEPAEARDMPVVFMLSRELPAHLDTVTLSYTFFEVAGAAAEGMGAH